MKLGINPKIKILADSGYQGLKLLYQSAKTPIKSSKYKPLTRWQKLYNKILSSRRVVVENIIRSVKIFRILVEKYRNRRKRFGLRFNLIAGIYNWELVL